MFSMSVKVESARSISLARVFFTQLTILVLSRDQAIQQMIRFLFTFDKHS